MDFKRLVTAVSLLAVFTMALRISVTSDTWWHLRAGSWMLENRELLREDPFSFTRLGQPWRYPGWLAQIGMTLTFDALGLPGLNLFTAVSVLIGFAFVWRISDGSPLLKGFAFVLAAASAGVYWSARPQILTFALTGAWLWAMERARLKGPRSLWIWVVLIALWSNLHGGFAVGMLLVLVDLAAAVLDRVGGSRVGLPSSTTSSLGLRQLGLGAALSAAAVGLNPNGLAMLGYPFRTISIGVLQDYIQEWQSPNFHAIEVQPFLWMGLLTTAFVALSPLRPSWRELLRAATFAYLGFLAARNIALFALVALPILTHHLSGTLRAWFPPRPEARRLAACQARRLNVAILILLLPAAALKSLRPLAREANTAAVREQAPVAAINALLEQGPPGPLFNSYNWGSYLIWAGYPRYLSFVDGRTDLFDDQILSEYLHLWRADPGWERIVERWGLRTALLEPEAPVVRELLSAGWRILYEDSQALILSRG